MTGAAPLARLVCAGFHGTTPSGEILGLIRRGVGGVILFGRNVESPEQVAALVHGLKSAAAPGRLVVAIDQEGGRVARLRDGFTPVPAMATIGRSDDAALAEQIGSVLGAELRAVGIDLDLAPVLDVDTNPANPVIGDRAFGGDPGLVARLGVALALGIQAAGVAACGKHFPGHGDTAADSHAELPRLRHAMERLGRVELPPFAAAAEAGVAAIMAAHVVAEAIDPGAPATLSEAAIRGVLRGRLGFAGLVVSDDLEMGAITRHLSVPEAAVRAVAAGVDLLTVCHSADRVHACVDALEAAAARDDGFAARAEEARARVAAFAARWARPAEPPDLARLRTPDHLAASAACGRVDAPRGADPTAYLPAQEKA